jgi:hypothetical protein
VDVMHEETTDGAAQPLPLTQYSPLEVLELPGLGAVDCSGLILIVGPNSSGKSQLLHDINFRVTGQPRTPVVAKRVGIRRLDHQGLQAALEAVGFMRAFQDDAGRQHLRPLTTYAGSNDQPGQVEANQVASWHQQHRPGEVSARTRDEYLWYFGRFLVTALFLERRLTSLSRTGLIDFVNSPPQHDLHALYVNAEARNRLIEEVRVSFNMSAWPDISQGNGICLRVSNQPDVPSAEDRLSPHTMAAYRTIETEGDGLKSYLSICIALLLGRRPVCMVDEPEMCLHPPQAYNLGRFIGKFGSSREGVTFVATHSSHILRGVIRTAPKLQIVRLTRLGGTFNAHVVSAETLETALAKPTVRAESVLDGIFAQAVIVLEADGDRTVYQAVRESLDQEIRLDAHFAAVGGIGGIADTCALYRTLRIPVAVIADLDVIADPEKLTRVLDALGCSTTKDLVREARRIVGLVRRLPPTISEHEVRTELSQAMSDDLSWEQHHDVVLGSTLRRIARRLDRMARLRSLTQELPVEVQNAVKALLGSLAQAGLFVVHVGELEQWLSSEQISASKKTKWAWANEAATLIRKLSARDDDIWAFMRSVFGFLDQRLLEFSGGAHSTRPH